MPNEAEQSKRIRLVNEHPASDWKPGKNYKNHDWSAHDQEDLPKQVVRQIHAETKHGKTGRDTIRHAQADEAAARVPSVQKAAGRSEFLNTLDGRARDATGDPFPKGSDPQAQSAYSKMLKKRMPKGSTPKAETPLVTAGTVPSGPKRTIDYKKPAP